MKQRLVLSLLSILTLVYIALPDLPIEGDFRAVLFTWVWLGFCLMAFGGNMAGLLYGDGKKKKPGKGSVKKPEKRSRERERGI